ncbi:hypothetical protein STRCI_008378 [Streptomyces cinnabarinus]|uniref:DUF4034 domain-containing protein n=1 Tax=Streptomyces cinnabarinus TaxID=67287 RepID=A0ABY7KT84_9ACTN|nr:hypothetical protein [Streptomyces cinnabarinus]WAZ26748.1 hypothetical protein STRCI_008378 [Streptomyces cinnabarinus]
MSFFSISRKGTPAITLELDDVRLGKLLKSLRATMETVAMGRTDVCVAQVENFLTPTPQDWDRRSFRLAVLARFLSKSPVPSEWARTNPDNATALILHAWSTLCRARTTGNSEGVSRARTDCLRAADLAPQDPTPWIVLLEMGRLERHAPADVFQVWNEVVLRDRWNREAYLSMMRYLTPDEGGSRLQVLEFVDSLRARVPANAPCVATELTSQVLHYQSIQARGGVEGLMARNFWTDRQVNDTLDRAAQHWARPSFFNHAAALADLNTLAYALMATNRRRDAHPAFQAIGSAVTHWPWQFEGDPVTVFQRMQARAKSGQ